MAGLLSTTIMDDAALLLNDAARLTFTYAILSPWLKKALDALSDELAVNNIPLLEKISVVYPAISGSTTYINLPADAIYPIDLHERAFGSSDKWLEMYEVNNIDPNLSSGDRFSVWAFQGTILNSSPVIDLPNANNAREIRLTYQRFVSTVGVDSTTDFSTALTFHCKRYLSAKLAEYITRFILKDTKRGDEIKVEANEAIVRLVQIWVKKRQNRPVRKPGFNRLSQLDQILAPAGGGSASPTPLPTSPFYDYYVRNYGAVGDGFTDDTAAINNTITAALATGGRVIFDPKNYLVSTTITVGVGIGRPIWLVGYGRNLNVNVPGTPGTTIKWIGTVANQTVLKFVQHNGGGIYDINIDCGVTAGAVIAADYGFHIEASVGCRYSELNVFRAKVFGFRLIGDVSYGVYRNIFSGLSTDFTCVGGMIHESTSILTDVANNIFESCAFSFTGVGPGLDLKASDTNFFIGLVIVAFSNASGDLMYMRNTAGANFGCKFNSFYGVDGGVSTGAAGPTFRSDSTSVNIIHGLSSNNGIVETFLGTHPENIILSSDVSGASQSNLFQVLGGRVFGNSVVPMQVYFDSSANKVRFSNHDAAVARNWIFSGSVGAGAEAVAFEIDGAGKIYLAGRAVAEGDWTTPAYAAGNYTASAGTWTTVAGTTQLKYSLTGNKTIRLAFHITGSTVSNAGAVLQILLPAGVTSKNDLDLYFPCRISDNGGASAFGMIKIPKNSTSLQIFINPAGGGFAISVANTSVQCGEIEFEYQ